MRPARCACPRRACSRGPSSPWRGSARRARREFALLLDAFGVEVVSLTAELATLATEAWERWGKGRHPAGLNIVDCCSYALAMRDGAPLLAIGDDFARTDVPLGRLR